MSEQNVNDQKENINCPETEPLQSADLQGDKLAPYKTSYR